MPHRSLVARHLPLVVAAALQGCAIDISPALGGRLGAAPGQPAGSGSGSGPGVAPGPVPGSGASPGSGAAPTPSPTRSPDPGPSASPTPQPAPTAAPAAARFRIQAFAGDASGSAGNSHDNVPVDAALLSGPAGVAAGPDGAVYLADYQNHLVRKVKAGAVVIVAGWGAFGFAGDGGPARDAQLSRPFGVATGADGRLAIADYGNDRVRVVDKAGIIRTVAGGGAGTPVDGAAASASALAGPAGVAFGLDGTLYIAEFVGHRVWRLRDDGKLAAVAGTGQAGAAGDGGDAKAAQVKQPVAVLPDSRGGCWIADYGNNRVRYVDSVGKISTIAGTGDAGADGDGGLAVKARLNGPSALAMLPDGSLLIADMSNNKVRMIGPDGVIRTVAGSGHKGNGGDGGPAVTADLDSPVGLTLLNGAPVVADFGNNRLRLLSPAP